MLFRSTVSVACSPSATLAAVRALDLAVGDSTTVSVAEIDVDTLAVKPVQHTYSRVSERRWSLSAGPNGFVGEFEVDDDGVLLHAQDWFRGNRLPAAGDLP